MLVTVAAAEAEAVTTVVAVAVAVAVPAAEVAEAVTAATAAAAVQTAPEATVIITAATARRQTNPDRQKERTKIQTGTQLSMGDTGDLESHSWSVRVGSCPTVQDATLTDTQPTTASAQNE